MHQTHFIVCSIMYSNICIFNTFLVRENLFFAFMGNLLYSLLSYKEQIICRISTECVNTKMFLSCSLWLFVIDPSSQLKLLVQSLSLMFSKYESHLSCTKNYHRSLKSCKNVARPVDNNIFQNGIKYHLGNH